MSNDNFMLVEEAMDIVYELAEQNALDPDEATDPELKAQAHRQRTALNVIHDFAVNVITG